MSKTKIILFTLVAILMPFYNSLAQQLEKIPGQEPVGESDLIGYLDSLYKFGISITGILAIFMIAFGAFGYIVTSAGNSSKKIDAKEKISNALIGLIIALTAYLFLYVINPDLVRGTLRGPVEILNDLVHNEKKELSIGDPCRTFSHIDDNDKPVYYNPSAEDCEKCPGGEWSEKITAGVPTGAFCVKNSGEPPSPSDDFEPYM